MPISNCTKGEENVGMVMTFTLVSHLREQLSILLRERIERAKKEEQEKERLELEAWSCSQLETRYLYSPYPRLKQRGHEALQ